MTDNAQKALAVEFVAHDIGDEVTTVRGYMRELLHRLFEEGESFSGKRPFGNSGWEYDVIKPLVKAKMIPGEIDDYGDLVRHDEEAAETLIHEMIDAL